MSDFVHLHVHTHYSLLDGQASVEKLVDKAIRDGMPGMAITDHGNMMGIKEFFNYVGKKNKALKEEGKPPFKPIFGCEMYVAHRRLTDKDKNQGDNQRYHLIVLAKNEKGYHNLIKLVSKAWTEGLYTRPRTDHVELEQHAEGLIVCSACLAGEVPRRILNGDIAGAEEVVQWYKRVFGDDYYLELQRHRVTDPNIRANRETYPLQQQVNVELLRIAEKYGIKCVCTNDVHFVDEEHAEAHDRLLCVGTKRDLDDPDRMLYSKQEWFKTTEEMKSLFADVPEAITNTLEVLDKCEFYSIDHPPIMPTFPIPEDFGTEEEYRRKFTDEDLFAEFTHDEHGREVCTPEQAEKKVKQLGGVEKLYRLKLEADYLEFLARKGAREIYGDPLSEEVEERIIFELHVMKTMGFPGYFLIVQDYINSARNELGVSVGPGRGSAAGSVVAYCLGITKVDPIRYQLLFERFLNPDRISLPDIDVDFDDDGRGLVLNWVTQKYGKANVTHIITYGTMATKSAIADVARVQQVPLNVSLSLTKAIPDKLPDDENGKPRKMNLKNVLACVPEIQQAAASTDRQLSDTIKYAQMLEGNVRNTGVHACGVIICRDDVSDWVPVCTADDKETGQKVLCTQYEGAVIEDTGLIKMDFLGLKTLSILKEAIKNIHDSLGIDLNIDKVDIEDPATFQLFCDGLTTGVFQFESPGMQKYLRELQPSVFEDLIAMNALYRPGPMQYIEKFINRKHGREKVEYDLDCMDEYLSETYGITVYQEQVMLLSRKLANFTRGESDTLRKAMGKKQKDKLDHMYPQFIEGGKSNGHDAKTLEKIWKDWESFASYAFNKSHATCYAWVAMQTAYLKANFPAEYMAGVMSRNFFSITEITKVMAECKALGILTLGPNVNKSRSLFSVDDEGNIRFGLAAIKGLGGGAAESIERERISGGPFKDIFDFVQRINISEVKRNGLEALAKSGALDCFEELQREQYFVVDNKGMTFLDALVKHANAFNEKKDPSELFLFDNMDDIPIATPPIPTNFEPWGNLERLNIEKDLIGIYLSANPLDDYEVVLRNFCNVGVAHLDDLTPYLNQEIHCGGIVTEVRTGVTRNGKPYGIVTIEDYSGKGEWQFWDDWGQWAGYLQKNSAVMISARVTPHRYDPKRVDKRVTAIRYLTDIAARDTESITIHINLANLTADIVQSLQEITQKTPGQVALHFHIHDPEQQMDLELGSRHGHIAISPALLSYIAATPGLNYHINDLPICIADTPAVEMEEEIPTEMEYIDN